MNKIIVTTGQRYTDLDALSCALSYTELLKLSGSEAFCVLPGPLNKSISESIRKWNFSFLTKPPEGNFNYVLVDISEPKFFANFVDPNRIIEVYDHRVGFEKYWKEKLGKSSHIERVGACTTLIWERFKESNLVNKISTLSANLIYTTTFSHTLNFQSSVTTKRDLKVFDEVSKFSKLPKNWVKKYFEDQDRESLKSPIQTIRNDTKIVNDIAIGQIELWDSRKFIKKYLPETENVLSSFGKKEWFLTSPSISEGKNYLFTKNNYTKGLLEKNIGAKFDGDIGTTKKLLLRKEILAIIQGFSA